METIRGYVVSLSEQSQNIYGDKTIWSANLYYLVPIVCKLSRVRAKFGIIR